VIFCLPDDNRAVTILIWPAVVLPMTRPFLSLPRPNKMQTSV
jgi:hypothetical protein